jgi:hypothetical protein
MRCVPLVIVPVGARGEGSACVVSSPGGGVLLKTHRAGDTPSPGDTRLRLRSRRGLGFFCFWMLLTWVAPLNKDFFSRIFFAGGVARGKREARGAGTYRSNAQDAPYMPGLCTTVRARIPTRARVSTRHHHFHATIADLSLSLPPPHFHHFSLPSFAKKQTTTTTTTTTTNDTTGDADADIRELQGWRRRDVLPVRRGRRRGGGGGVIRQQRYIRKVRCSGRRRRNERPGTAVLRWSAVRRHVRNALLVGLYKLNPVYP